MAQSYTSDRIIFKEGQQSKYILDCKTRLAISWVELAKIIKITHRTLYSWRKEKKKMAYDSAIILSKKSGIALPKSTKILKWRDHLKMVSIKGGTAKYKKYGKVGDEAVRRKAWENWWNKKGKYIDNKIYKRKEITIPPKDADLAEFVGIVMGDGCITEYTIRITLDSVADKEYISFVFSLVKRLFNITPVLYKHKKFRATDVVIQSKNVVDFCKDSGLKIGDKIKQNTDIPEWIKNDVKLSRSCIRGLIDTDGCIFKHCYKSNNKRYCYTKIAFTSRSKVLLKSVENILIKLGLCVRITKDGNDVRIENQSNVHKYIDIVGTSNPKFKSKIIKGDVSELA